MPLGPAPWHEGYRKVTKRGLKSRGYTHNIQHAWVPESLLNGAGPSIPMTNYRLLVAPNGQEYKAYGGEYVPYFGHHYDEDQVTNDMIDYIEKGFAKNAKFQAVKGVGHITLLEYNAYRQLLRVTFRVGNSVCVFFRVPKTVFGELYSLCDERKIDGSRRNGHNHLLGIRFWDLVRIRGTNHGAKYKFVYTRDAMLSDDVDETTGRPKVWRNAVDELLNADVDVQSMQQVLTQGHATQQNAKWESYKQSADFISNNDPNAARWAQELDLIAKENLEPNVFTRYTAAKDVEAKQKFLVEQNVLEPESDTSDLKNADTAYAQSVQDRQANIARQLQESLNRKRAEREAIQNAKELEALKARHEAKREARANALLDKIESEKKANNLLDILNNARK